MCLLQTLQLLGLLAPWLPASASELSAAPDRVVLAALWKSHGNFERKVHPKNKKVYKTLHRRTMSQLWVNYVPSHQNPSPTDVAAPGPPDIQITSGRKLGPTPLLQAYHLYTSKRPMNKVMVPSTFSFREPFLQRSKFGSLTVAFGDEPQTSIT